MAAILFDFDSTLVPCESLEQLCSKSCALAPEREAELAALTNAGMEGSMSFEQSLRARLAIARPSLAATLETAADLSHALTDGAPALVERLRSAGHEVWIVSGGFREILLATGRRLGLPDEAVHGVQCRWGPGGELVDLEPENGFLVSKVEGLRRLASLPAEPRIGVGDGATDLALREAGFVNTFVAYTEHARRAPVVADSDYEAASMGALASILESLIA